MASASRAEDQPPALPEKQHRGQSYRSSRSMSSDCVILSPVLLHHHNCVHDEVFTELTDCHASHCPVHQRYDPSQHQARFFSDDTPPPVPKKRLARTISLPSTSVSPPLPPSPLQKQPQNFDNPLYMLAPMTNTCFHEEPQECEPVLRSNPSSLSFSQLSFDTPDEHLPSLFKSFDDKNVLFQGIQHRQLLFLRSMTQRIEEAVILQHENTYQPEDFLMGEGSEPQQVGDRVYYSLQSPKHPGRVLALRIHTETDAAPSVHARHQPSHVNMQDVIARFLDIKRGRDNDPMKVTAESCLLEGQSVSIERDLPQATLEDFVLESSLERSVYDRQVCVLLLQILMGSQQLYQISASAAELRPQKIFLVWPNKETEEENKLQQDTSEVEGSSKETELGRTTLQSRIQMLWTSQGSPRVVLTPLSSVPRPLAFIKHQMRELIQYCLVPQRSSAESRSKSPYRRGLLYLASLLQDESNRPRMEEMLSMLQVLLWGPRLFLFNHRGSTTTEAVHNWLTLKRSLLVMKLAEQGLIQDQSVLDWEDCMHLQYLSCTAPEAVASVSSQLCLTLNVD
ncbi:inactive tyrosine-protein kinase PRAG1 [Aulostomus maculatus]